TMLDDKGYKNQYTITQGKVAEVGGKSPDFDFCISTVKFDESSCKCPLIIGTALLMGINTQPVIDKIIEQMEK
ncbi:MAG: hypothetical protein WBO70_01235, partial [Erysipelotrichaceae bacterium]